MTKREHVKSLLAALTLVSAAPTGADSTEARCEVYPAGEDHASAVLPCRFYQAQGHVVISRADGVEHDLTPVSGELGTFVDSHGSVVHRDPDLQDRGLIFRLPKESVYVYWNTAYSGSTSGAAPYRPAADLDFDATAWTRCRNIDAQSYDRCPSGVLRAEGGGASVVVEDPPGQVFTINFLGDYINATNREVTASRSGDTWTLIVNGARVYEIDTAFIEGD